MKITIILSLILSVIAGGFILNGSFPEFVLAAKEQKTSKPLEKAFPHSQKCKRCHIRVFEEWEASAQSRSIVSSAFRVMLDRYVASAPKGQESMCFRCHAPHILEYGHQAKMFLDEVKSKDPQIDGVGCSQCHLIKEVDGKKTSPTSNVSTRENRVWGL